MTGRSAHMVARVLIGVVALGAFVHVVTLFPTAWRLYGAVPARAQPVVLGVSASLLIAVLACSLALLLVVRAGRRYEARGLGLFLVLVAVCWGSILRFASLDRGPDGTPSALSVDVSGVQLQVAIAAVALAAAALLRLSVHFPTDLHAVVGRRPPWPRRAWVPWAVALAMPLLVNPGFGLALRTLSAAGLEREQIGRLAPAGIGAVALLAAGTTLGMVALAVANFVRGYRLAETEARRSALWLLVGVVGSACMVLAAALTMGLEIVLPIEQGLLSRYSPAIILLAPLFMVVSVGVAVLYAGAVDPSLALRRSTVNGIAGTVGLLIFAGLENTLSGWVESRLDLPGAVGSFLAGAVSAGAFLPIQRHLGRRMGRSE